MSRSSARGRLPELISQHPQHSFQFQRMVVESSVRPASSTSPRPSQRKPLPPASPKPKPVSGDGQGGGGPIRNPPCPLFDLVQYSCQPHFNYSPTTGERLKGGSVTCYPLPRVFRKCVPFCYLSSPSVLEQA